MASITHEAALLRHVETAGVETSDCLGEMRRPHGIAVKSAMSNQRPDYLRGNWCRMQQRNVPRGMYFSLKMRVSLCHCCMDYTATGYDAKLYGHRLRH